MKTIRHVSVMQNHHHKRPYKYVQTNQSGERLESFYMRTNGRADCPFELAFHTDARASRCTTDFGISQSAITNDNTKGIEIFIPLPELGLRRDSRRFRRGLKASCVCMIILL